MPNWCSNIVMIRGDNSTIQELVDFVDGGSSSFSLHAIMPMPIELKNGKAPERDEEVAKLNEITFGAKDWYDWANLNWGTKWDVDAKIVSDEGGVMLPDYRTVRFEFDSAWSPPLPVYEALAKKFPNTNIYAFYDEPGADFAGYVMYAKGEAVKERQFDSVAGKQYLAEPDGDIFDFFPDEGDYEEVQSATERNKIAMVAMNETVNKLMSKIKS